MHASVYAHIQMTTSVNAHIQTMHIRKLATSIITSFVYACFRICAYTDDTYKCTYKCAFTDDNFLKCTYLEAHIYGRCIWITVNFFIYAPSVYASFVYAHIYMRIYVHLWMTTSLNVHIWKHAYMEDAFGLP
jgi:hypothetical protein